MFLFNRMTNISFWFQQLRQLLHLLQPSLVRWPLYSKRRNDREVKRNPFQLSRKTPSILSAENEITWQQKNQGMLEKPEKMK